jgi:hypothetical protein
MGFRDYFNKQADLADELWRTNRAINCYITATAAIDALAELWQSDFPAEAQALSTEFGGGKVPSSVRMARFVRKFAADSRASKIAVIRFAEDALRFAPTIARSELTALLDSRCAAEPNTVPPSDRDVDLAALSLEAPVLLANPAVRRLVEEYFYPALLYSLYRCPMVHTLGWSRQTQGFARDDEVMYMKIEADFTSIGFGPDLVTHWLRASLQGYLDLCARAEVKPAGNVDPGAEHEQRLRRKWERL